MTPRAARPVLLLVLGGAAGCVGAIGDSGSRAPGGGADPATPGKGNDPHNGPTGGVGAGGAGATGGGAVVPPPATDLSADVMPVRRLTADEYDNTVRDLLGDTTHPARELTPDRDPAFGFPRPGVVSTLESERLRDAAEALAAAAVKDLGALLPCSPATPADEAGCARMFVEQFGARAYRRPLLPDEVQRLTALYQTGRTQLTLPFKDGIALVLEAMLQSAPFLYRWELGPQAPLREDAVFRLNGYEMASRLSYFLWSTMPDKDLFAAAAADRLGTPAEVEAQVRRMLADGKARDGAGRFFEEWLDLEALDDRTKDPAVYPEFDDALKAAMLAETRAFAGEVMFGADRSFATLLGASFSMIDEPLARLYGASGVTGPALRRVALDPAQRSGLLTHASFLAMTGSPQGSNPVIRGKEIYQRLLCKELPPPPPEVPSAKPPSAGGTTRQRHEEHARQECASGCHQLFEPFGYALEHYDGIGRFRTMDNGQMVDSTGVAPLDGGKHPFGGARELGTLIAQSEEAQTCFANQWLRFTFRREAAPGDEPSVKAAVERFRATGLDMRELLVAFATSRAFRYRAPSPGEGAP